MSSRPGFSPCEKLIARLYEVDSTSDGEHLLKIADEGFTVVIRDRSDFDKARVPVFNPWQT